MQINKQDLYRAGEMHFHSVLTCGGREGGRGGLNNILAKQQLCDALHKKILHVTDCKLLICYFKIRHPFELIFINH